MAVRIRMKKMGRRHRPFFRVCAVDSRAPRDGRVIEELGTYDPMIRDVDARTLLKNERIDYWLGVGAQPSEKVRVLIKKYGSSGTHLDQQKAAVERIKNTKPQAPPPMAVPKPKPAAEETPAQDSTTDETAAGKPAETTEGSEGSPETAEQKSETPASGGEVAGE